jgi:hypothetical protein
MATSVSSPFQVVIRAPGGVSVAPASWSQISNRFDYGRAASGAHWVPGLAGETGGDAAIIGGIQNRYPMRTPGWGAFGEAASDPERQFVYYLAG